jgi:hypothetical protein
MGQTFIAFADLLAATALVGFLLLLPGAAIATFTGWLGVKELARSYHWGAALLFSFAILPALLSLIARLVNLDTAVATLVALALLGIPAVTKMERPPFSAVCGLLVCAVVVGFELGDFRSGGKLYHSTFALDMVKHVATVNSILSWGLPLTDPFVSRAQPAGYYYFFYIVAAMPVRLTMGVLDVRAAVGALAVFDGAALLALAILLWQKCKLGPPASANVVFLLIALLLCGNLDIVANLPSAIASRIWPIEIEWWNEQVLPWTFSLFWVPHHVLALIAGVFGLLLISERPGTASAIAGGIAFASCAGASVWVGLAVALTALFWLVSLLIRRELRLALPLAAAGCLACLLLVPLIFDLVHGRADEGSPIALGIRSFYALDGLVPPGLGRSVLNLILLPVNYFIEFGVFSIGAVIFLFLRDMRSAPKTEAARILGYAAAAGLLLGTFTRSTILNNDLGWRVVLLPQLAFLIWTAAVILARNGKFKIAECRQWPGAMGLLLMIGYAGNVYELVSARAYPFLVPNVAYVPRAVLNPEVDDELASAYSWANSHVPRDAILQHNPVSDLRVLDFGLYGRNRVAVADSEATLYGAPRSEVDARLAAIGPIFTTKLSPAEVRDRALVYGIDVFVVSSADPVWSDQRDWVWSTPVVFASPHVRLIATRDLVREAER